MITPYGLPAQALLLAALMMGAGQAAAQTSYGTRIMVEAQHAANYFSDPSRDDGYLELDGQAQVPGRRELSADSDHDPSAFNGWARAWTDVRPGGMHLFAQTQAVSMPLQQRTFAKADASGFFSDWFALNVPGAASGALFTVTAQILSHASQSAIMTPGFSGWTNTNDRGASASLQTWSRVLGAGGGMLAEARAQRDCLVSNATAYFCNEYHPFGLATLSFTMANNGAPVLLDLRGWVTARASANADTTGLTADGLADMGHTLAWAGVSTLHDAGGALVAGPFSLLSATSGFDYAQAYVSAVPEPGAAALLLAGLLTLGWRTRRRG